MDLQFRPALAPASDVPATAMNGSGTSWDQLAEKYWLKSAPASTARPDAIKSVWDALEQDGFSDRTVAYLENLQIFENFLWPTYNEESSNQHVLLLAIVFNAKQKANLESWSVFADRQDEFPSFYKRILSFSLDTSLPTSFRLALLNFVIGSFQSLDRDFVRKECAPLVSIAIWHNLHDDAARTKAIEKSSTRRKAWKAAQKRYDAANTQGQARMKFDRSWLFAMILDFLSKANTAAGPTSSETIYAGRFLELLCGLTSQLPTRRYTSALIQDLNVLPVLRRSRLYQKSDNTLVRDLAALLNHFQTFTVDEGDGTEQSSNATRAAHHDALSHLQQIAFKHFEEKLKVLALSNYASIDKREELEQSFVALNDGEVETLCKLLGLRTSYPPSSSIPVGRGLWQQILLDAYERPTDFRDVVRGLSISPTETLLYDEKYLQHDSYDGSAPLALPKLNLQYLSLTDFMWRSFQLYQAESFYSIRKDLESIIKRMKPKSGREKGSIIFEGFSKMAMPIDKPAILEVSQPKVGTSHPGFVRAEVIIDVGRLTDSMRAEWDSLKPKDTVFLMSVKPTAEPNGTVTSSKKSHASADVGIDLLRTAEIVQVLDENNKPLRDTSNGWVTRSRKRHLLLDLDSVAFQADKDRAKSEIYTTINVIARRQGRENNFKPVLETIQSLVQAQTSLPSWLEEVFLGYGDPKSASYAQLEDKIQSIDFLDTFLDWEHLKDSFPGRQLEGSGDASLFRPPYVLEPFAQPVPQPPTNPKKRRRDQVEDDQDSGRAPVRVKTYKPRNNGPYPVDVPRKNRVRFTPTQVEAIVSGTQPGLSVIVGPPGTGKTDVATQIINLLYHNFPSERILLIAHSNQALNQLFQKIIALDIDSRHLLRLGHGEEELESQASYSKAGRVESFLENRQSHLSEVSRLAASINAEGAHGSSCETADYFNQVYIKPAWARFWQTAKADKATRDTIVAAFPFYRFFSNAPVPELFPTGASPEQAIEVATDCEHHLNELFTDLEAIRPFEILRHPRDQANHLLIKEARIIAMTSTHAAVHRSEIASLNFHYDTLIMEEAAQITEIESFIPFALQNPSPATGTLPLKRAVLIGDHLQNAPVIQNLALRNHSNFSQSLFQRLVRLSVPTITLDAQGRSRPSITALYRHRYPTLTDLPHTLSTPQFQTANPGLLHTSQFIDIPPLPYGNPPHSGELEPTPHFIQNLAEAEYAVALYQYMRLLSYPAKSITILTPYAGQRALIRDVLTHRCARNPLFGMPRSVSTVDRYQGEQNDYIILSLVRTKSVGYLRDVRRVTVALSRARLGLYVLGSLELWRTCVEMGEALEVLTDGGKRGTKLVVTQGEIWPLKDGDGRKGRIEGEVVEGTEMEGVEHLGEYVYRMTEAKVKALGGRLEVEGGGSVEEVEDGEAVGEGEDVEEDPLHESVV